MVVLRDVAEAAGVSTATASNVFTGTKLVSSEVAKRVLQAARELGYVPNRAARNLRTGRSRTLGLLVPDLANPFFPALVRSLERSARAQGYALLVMDAGDEPTAEDEALKILSSYCVDGLLWVPVANRALSPLPFPVVTIDRPVDNYDAVCANHRQGGALIAAYAAALGHCRVGLLSGPCDLSSAKERRDGLLEAAQGVLEVVWQLEVPFAQHLPPDADELLLRGECTLIICANDAVAVGAIRVLREGRVHVPNDVSIVGFDNVAWAAFVEPALSTVEQPLEQMGCEAVELLLRRIDAPEAPREHRVLPVELVHRSSVKNLSLQPKSAHRGSVWA